MKKNELRKQVLTELKSFPAASKKKMELEISKILFQHPAWLSARTVALTLSLPFEFSTEEIMRHAWAEGKRVVVPIPRYDYSMKFVPFAEGDPLSQSAFGIWEPLDKEGIQKSEIDLILVPVLAITRVGDRLGFGGGFFDRYLADYQGTTLSLVLPFQILPPSAFPVEATDKQIQIVITADANRHHS
ncbi:MAG: 5-formyltetrahydrofolate cyclo-ligase [Streptococcaceae bacterium]|nr:5-formyltetrahydrofolate cyclo-ligase [Streptococcaceae bacterium]